MKRIVPVIINDDHITHVNVEGTWSDTNGGGSIYIDDIFISDKGKLREALILAVEALGREVEELEYPIQMQGYWDAIDLINESFKLYE